MRVAAHPHRHQLDEGRTLSGPRPLGGPRKRGRNDVGIGAVDRDARNAVADGLVGKHAGSRLLGHRRRQRGLIVLDAEDGRQPSRRAQIDGLVPLAERRPALTDKRDRHAV